VVSESLRILADAFGCGGTAPSAAEQQFPGAARQAAADAAAAALAAVGATPVAAQADTSEPPVTRAL
jgi:hypothetical protein